MAHLHKRIDMGQEYEPYRNAADHLTDELELLNLRMQLWLEKEQGRRNERWFENPADGFATSAREINELLTVSDPMGSLAMTAASSPLEHKLLQRLEERARCIANRRKQTLLNGRLLPFERLTQLFSLSSFEEGCLLLGLAPQLDRKYERVFAYIEDDPALDKPTVGIAMKLYCGGETEMLALRQALEEDAPLIRYRLIRLLLPRQAEETALPGKEMVLDERIVQFLFDSSKLDFRLRAFAALVQEPMPDEELAPLVQEERVRVGALLMADTPNGSVSAAGHVFNLVVQDSPLAHTLVEGVSSDAHKTILLVNTARMIQTPAWRELIRVLIRETLLQDAVIYIRSGSVQQGEDWREGAEETGLLHSLIGDMAGHSITAFIEVSPSSEWNVLGATVSNRMFIRDVALLKPMDSLAEWSRLSRSYPLDSSCDLNEYASQYGFSSTLIKEALQEAMQAARWRAPGRPVIQKDELYASCRKLMSRVCKGVGNLVDPLVGWGELALPEDTLTQLKAIATQFRNRRLVLQQWGFGRPSGSTGMQVLFSGPAGAGKTLAARALAHELNRPLLQANVAQLLGKYARDGAASLRRLMTVASMLSAILLLDNTEEWLNPDNRERAEWRKLLRQFEGLAILTVSHTNYWSEAHDQFHAQIVCTLPKQAELEELWQRMIPEAAPVDELDIPYLARTFKLTVLEMQFILQQAAFAAAEEQGVIGMKELVRAIDTMKRRKGMPCQPGEFGIYAHHLHRMEAF